MQDLLKKISYVYCKEYNISETFQRTFAAEFVISSLGLDTIQQTSNEIDNARIKRLRTKIVNPGFPKVWLVKLTVIEISRRQGFFD